MNLFDIAKKKQQVEELEEQTKANEFWTDMEKSAKVLQEIKALKDKIDGLEKTKNLIDDTNVLIELGNEANDESVIPEIKQNVKTISKNIDKMAISVGKRPLQGTKLFVIIAISRSRGESMIRQPTIPAALHPKPMHIVRLCLPHALHFLK